MSKYFDKIREKISGENNWLKDFADRELQKESNHLGNILDIVSKNKKSAIEEKVQDLRARVGLDMLETMEKEGTGEVDKKTARPLSIRDKAAELDQGDQKKNKILLDKIKEFVTELIKTRNGHVTTPGLIDSATKSLDLDLDWVKETRPEIEALIVQARKGFSPEVYKEDRVSPKDLAYVGDIDKYDTSDEESPIAGTAASPTNNT